MRIVNIFAVYLASIMVIGQAAMADSVAELGAEIWQWRAVTQPATSDDIPRIVRPAGWVPDWSEQSMKARYQVLSGFEARFKAVASVPETAPEKTDYHLIGSALSRARWELDHVAAWKRQPHFYTAQALIPIFEVLLPPPPVERDRIGEVIRLVDNIPAVLSAGKRNLTDRRGPFVQVALTQLEAVAPSLKGMEKGLLPYLSQADQVALTTAIEKALKSFDEFASFLAENREGLSQETAVGRESYQYFLSSVALYPYTPEKLLLMGSGEWERTAAFEEIERNRNTGFEDLPIADTVEDVIDQLNKDELIVRSFMVENEILSVPEWVGHYNGHAFPEYLKPIAWLGRTFDLTNRNRLDENATVYLPDPSPNLGFFNLSIARDPRPIIVHEGVPGHYFQLALSWANPNPLRRHYYDSGANEGTGFYAEEMMLQAGFFDDAPKTREIIYTFSRLRALRVEVDVKLALGEFTIAEAADYLEEKMQMDRATAEEEAIFFAATPGQAISYQIGKLQTFDFMSAAKLKMGDGFKLQDFHDYLWTNGNVPISLLKEEYLAK